MLEYSCPPKTHNQQTRKRRPGRSIETGAGRPLKRVLLTEKDLKVFEKLGGGTRKSKLSRSEQNFNTLNDIWIHKQDSAYDRFSFHNGFLDPDHSTSPKILVTIKSTRSLPIGYGELLMSRQWYPRHPHCSRDTNEDAVACITKHLPNPRKMWVSTTGCQPHSRISIAFATVNSAGRTWQQFKYPKRAEFARSLLSKAPHSSETGAKPQVGLWLLTGSPSAPDAPLS